jgi:hypothetical protein
MLPFMLSRTLAGILAPLIVFVGLYLWARSHPYTVTTSTEIAAPADRVWAILLDLDAYDHWNPEITVETGHLVRGETLTLRIRSEGGTSTVRPTVREIVPNRELRWSSRYHDVGGLADADQSFTIEPTGPGTVRFTQAETFRGVGVPFFHDALASSCSRFDKMNAALKTRAESPKKH